VIDGFKRGQITPVLGAGVNSAGDSPREVTEWLQRFPPSGRELADYLAEHFEYPIDSVPDLLKISQYVYAVGGGWGPLYSALHDVFDVDFPTTPLHDFLGSVPGALREVGYGRRAPLIVTTNYDDLMESALRAHGEEFDLLVYAAEGRHSGQLCMRTPEGYLEPVTDPKTNVVINPDVRTVVLKLHGFVDRGSPSDANDDSYVITEDHYIEYLARMDLDNLIPVKVLERLRNCHFLFLGYSLSDWNLRALLHNLWQDRRWAWWAIQLNPGLLERSSWRHRGVDIFDMPLNEYLDALRGRFGETLDKARARQP
jgi:hypothetical protein